MPTDENLPDVSDPGDLYSLPLDMFTGARDRLAARLRAEGKSEEATAVGRLRKPSMAAWALNRAVRQSPELVANLLETHRRLRQSESMEMLGVAAESRREALAALVGEAVAELAADGRAVSAQTRDRITRTLLAVATDPQGEADLEAGVLLRELEPSGGGWGDIGLATLPPAVSSHREARAADKARERAEHLEREAVSAEQRLDQAKQALTAARRRAKQARAHADEAAEEARRAEEVYRETMPNEDG